MALRYVWVLFVSTLVTLPSGALASNCGVSAAVEDAEKIIVRLSETEKRGRRQRDFDEILRALKAIGASPRAHEVAALSDYVENRISTVVFLRDDNKAAVSARLTAFPPFSIVSEIREAEAADGCPAEGEQESEKPASGERDSKPGTLALGRLSGGVSISGSGESDYSDWFLYGGLGAGALVLRFLYRRVMRNRRANVRHFCNFPALIHARPGVEAVETKVVDFSIGGAKVRARGISVTQDEPMTIDFEGMTFEAHVAWIRRRHFGIRFVEPLSDRTVSKLRASAGV